METFISSTPFASERYVRNLKYYKRLAGFGYNDSYCVPRRFGRDSCKAMFLLFSKGASREDFRRQIELSNPVLPMVFDAIVYFGSTKFPQHFFEQRFNSLLSITPKPLQVLEIVAKDGLMLKETAIKLCISLDTANKHVATIKQALGATTLANAVYLAMMHGLIKEDKGELGRTKTTNKTVDLL